jgi:hypothetical protein
MSLRFWSRPPRFNYFKALRAILDEAIPGIGGQRGLSGDEVRGALVGHLQCFSREYRTGCKPQNPYHDPLCRLAYVYCYLPANANLCEIAIKRSDDLSELVTDRLEEEGELKVCAFGGGPGTELLALAKFLINEKRKARGSVSFTLLDEIEEWAETWSLTEKQIRSFLKSTFGKPSSWPFTISKSFIPFDITAVENYGNVRQLFGQDLYILNYVVSELFEDNDLRGLRRLIRAMVESSQSGSKVLVIDRNESRVVRKARDLLADSGLTISETFGSKENMDYDEQVSDLGGQLIREHYPRVKWDSFWIIGTKE